MLKLGSYIHSFDSLHSAILKKRNHEDISDKTVFKIQQRYDDMCAGLDINNLHILRLHELVIARMAMQDLKDSVKNKLNFIPHKGIMGHLDRRFLETITSTEGLFKNLVKVNTSLSVPILNQDDSTIKNALRKFVAFMQEYQCCQNIDAFNKVLEYCHVVGQNDYMDPRYFLFNPTKLGLAIQAVLSYVEHEVGLDIHQHPERYLNNPCVSGIQFNKRSVNGQMRFIITHRAKIT